MNQTHRTSRRQFLGSAAAASLALSMPAIAQGPARVVVIGGGFGGASCARALHQLEPGLNVTLVESNKTFIACPFTNTFDVVRGNGAISCV